MAKRITLAIGMLVLVAAMIVPMLVTTSSANFTQQNAANARTDLTHFNPSHAASYTNGRKYISTAMTANKEYTFTLEFFYGNYQWDYNWGGSTPIIYMGNSSTAGGAGTAGNGISGGMTFPSSNGGTGTVFFKNCNYNHASTAWPSATSSASYSFEVEKYYIFEFVVRSNGATIRVNGKDVLTYSGTTYINTNTYWHVSPRMGTFDFLADRIVYSDGTLHHKNVGNATLITGWCGDGDYWQGNCTDGQSGSQNDKTSSNRIATAGIGWYDLNRLRAVSIALTDLKDVGSVTANDRNSTSPFNGPVLSYTFPGRGTWTGYTDFKFTNQGTNYGGGGNPIPGSSKMTVKLRMRDISTASSNGRRVAWFGFSASTYSIGYDFAQGKWGIMSGAMNSGSQLFYADVATSRAFTIDTNRFYTVVFEFYSDHLALYVDDELLIYTKNHGVSNYTLYMWPSGMTCDFAVIDWVYLDVNNMFHYRCAEGMVNGNTMGKNWYPEEDANYAPKFAYGAIQATSQAVKDATMKKYIWNSTHGNYWLTSDISYESTGASKYSSWDSNCSTINTKIKNACTAIQDIGTVAYTTASNNLITTAETNYNNVDNAFKSDVWNYSVLTTARNKYTALGYENYINTNLSSVTTSSGSYITTAQGYASANATAWGMVSQTYKDKLTNANAAYTALTGANAYSASNTTTSSNRATMVSKRDALQNLAAGPKALIATATYNAVLAQVNGAIDEYDHQQTYITKVSALSGTPTAAASWKTALGEASTAYASVSNTSAVSSYKSTYDSKSSAYTTAVNNEVSRINGLISGVSGYTAASDAAITAAENATNASTNSYMNNTDVSGGLTSGYATTISNARADYAAINPVYTEIAAISPVTLASGSALTTARTDYDALSTDARRAKIDSTLGSGNTLADKESAYTARIPTVYMTGTPDSSKIKANVYFLLTDGEDPSAITITVDGVSRALNGAGVTTKSAGEGKTYYILSTTKPAKQMTQSFAYSISGYGNTYDSGTTTVAGYCNALLGYTGEKQTEVRAVAQAMLNYGRAAQVYFKYPQENPTAAQLPANSTAVPETAMPVGAARFDSSSLVALTSNVASCPVGYSAINVTFKDDTTLYIAFRIKDNSTAAKKTAALNWVKEHVTFGGNTGDALNAVIQEKDGSMYSFVIISIKNIPIKNINVEQPILVDGASAGALTVMNYIVISQKSSDANLKALTQGLLAYYNAITALITP